jgi:hypothetical protein
VGRDWGKPTVSDIKVYESDNGWPPEVPNTSERAYLGFIPNTSAEVILDRFRKQWDTTPEYLAIAGRVDSGPGARRCLTNRRET